MFNRPLRRALALLLCLTLLSTLALAEDADITVDPFELPVEEAGDFILAPDPAEDALPEGDVPTEVSPAEVQPAPEGEAQPQEPAEPAPEGESVPQTQTGPALMAFAETAAVASDTWQSVDLRRADGFTGPLAQVTGKLTLAGALIDGVPARQVSLLDFFALGPTGSIAISDDAQLSLSLSAFSFNKGSSKTLKLTWNGASLSAKKAKWTTSNAKIVKVS